MRYIMSSKINNLAQNSSSFNLIQNVSVKSLITILGYSHFLQVLYLYKE
jgi:hypothetical protein